MGRAADRGVPGVDAATGGGSLLETALAAGGETGRLMGSIDWSTTPLGPMSRWPTLLRGMVATCMLSPFPMAVCWGPELTYIYNDATRPLLGRKHPDALGRPKRDA